MTSTTTETNNTIPAGMMALNLTCGAITTRRHVRDGEMSGIIEADKKEDAKGVVDGRKEILRSALIAKIKAAQQALGNAIRGLSVPTGDVLFKRGVYVIKAQAIPLIEAAAEEKRAEIANLLIEVESVYPLMREQAEQRLTKVGMWNPSQFPTMEDIRYGARIEMSYVGINVPETLASVSADLFEREKEKARLAWEDAKAESVRALREEMASLVEHLRDRLEPGADGKPKIFRDSLMENISTFCDQFPMRDVAGDSELASIVESLKTVTQASPDSIRSSSRLRDTIAATVGMIKETADTLVTTAPVRKFRF